MNGDGDLDRAVAADVNPELGKEALDLDLAHVFHSWSAQAGRTPWVIAGGQGSYVWDFEGNRYLDFSSQLVNTNIGHQHPVVVEAIAEQARTLTTIAPQHVNLARSRAARDIVALAPGNMNKVFFTNGGADAIENAIRMARLHTNRTKVLSFYRSYHGNTGSAINATGDPRRWPNEFAHGHVHFFGPHVYRSHFHSASAEEEAQRALEHLADVIAFEGPSTIACIVLESVVGTAGIITPPPGYLAGVKALCEQHGIVYIADEVMAGFGRTGRWFAFEHFDVQPDLIVFAKGVNSGYLPLGGIIISDDIAATFDSRVFPGGLTYSGHPLACASAVATIKVMQDEGIVENSARIGEQVLGPGLRALADKHQVIGDVRGLGTFWCLDLVMDRSTKEPLAPYGGSSPAMAALVEACKSNGLMPFTNYNRLHVVPPLNISDADAREGLSRLDKALESISSYYKG